MPIKPENIHKYPANWKDISKWKRQEAGQRCEQCRICNGSTGYRLPDGRFRAVSHFDQRIIGTVLNDFGAKLIKIVLTVHHRNGDPQNNNHGNLIALCQRCHLQADRELRKGKLTI